MATRRGKPRQLLPTVAQVAVSGPFEAVSSSVDGLLSLLEAIAHGNREPGCKLAQTHRLLTQCGAGSGRKRLIRGVHAILVGLKSGQEQLRGSGGRLYGSMGDDVGYGPIPL